jgi:alpha,alpha-trehalose-phosphate synthase [UDP-forming]
MINQPRVICLSNRLPVSVVEDSESIHFQPSTGGLVAAIEPILSKSKGVWIGWPGKVSASEATIVNALQQFSDESDFELFSVHLDRDSISGFYEGFSNSIIWPLFHDLQSRCNFEPEFWSAYLEVQKKFCTSACNHIGPEDLIWVQDYHLMGLGSTLREGAVTNKISFFLHTPFPSADIFMKLPWRIEVMNSMLCYDLIGFQTNRDLKNFIECLGILTNAKCHSYGNYTKAKTENRETILGCFPISIDFNDIEEIANSSEVEKQAKILRDDMNVDFLVLSIDRLDYTKGIPHRIRAFKKMLELKPELKRRIALLQVVVPSRVEVPEYQLLKSEIEQLVTLVNGELGEPGWVPVHHLFRSMTREEVISFYLSADVALVTPLKDGMNLVSKEYCAARIYNNGALVLSEFAGAADELKDYSFIVNPYDLDGVANALLAALEVSVDLNDSRMKSLRNIIKNADVYNWASHFLKAAGWDWTSTDSTPEPASIWRRFKRITNVFDV